MFKELLNRRVVKVLLSVLFISGLTNVVPAQAVTLTPFTCSPGFYQVSNTGSGAIYSSSISNTGVLTFTKAPSATIIGSMNAIGYNTADNFIYGVVADKLYKIDATGSETLVNGTGVITGALPGSPGSGDFIAPNKLMVYGASGKTTFFVIDVTTLVSTAVNFTTVGTVGPVTGAWDFTTQGNYAYGMSSDGKNLIRMDLTTVLNGGTSETVTSYAVNAATTAQAPNTNTAPTTGGGYGAAYSDFVGNVYFFNNSDSKAFQITAASLAGAPAPKSILMGGKASSPTLAGPNDGASCPKAASAYAPITVTANASSVTLTSAQLNGSVNPQTAGTSVTTTGSFCYTTNPHTDASGNLDTGCTWVTASSPSSGSIPVGSTPVSMSVTISGLTAGITYYFQAKGSNASGDSYGVVKSFTSDFTLTYDANGATSGSVPTQQIGTGNVTVAGNTSALIKTGATFGGWYTNAAGTGGTLYSPSSIYNLTTNTTLYAKWNVVSYTLTFNANGGSGSLSNITGSGDKSLPNYTPGITVPGSGANVFGGWNTKADGTGITYSVGETYTLAADATLYAKWNSANFTLTYQGDSVTTGSAPIAQTGNGALVVQDNVRGLAKSGQTFVGWVDTATNTNYLAGDTYNLTSNSVLTARWATTLYSLSYNANGATGGVTPPNESTTGTVGVASNDGNLTRNGYTFGGWALCSGGGAVSTVNVTANVSLCAIWTGITYTLTYNVNTSSGGTGTPPASENVTVPDTSVVLDLDTGTMSATGKSFAGWSRNTSGTGPSYSPGDSFELTTNTTLYAKWVTNVYTLIYNANGGSNAPSPTVGSGVMVLEDGSNMTPPSGKQFDGWNTKADGTGVDFLGGDNYDLRGNITLYAKWADQLFTLTYDGNNQDSGTAPLQAHGYGDVAVSDNDYGLAVTGKTFDGWNTRPDGTGFDFPAGTSYNLRADVTLYAQYATTLYTLTFDSNTAGATSAVTGFVPDPIVAAGTIILPGNSGLLTTATDKFTGWWNTKADGTGVTYTPGDGFELGADTTLFAKWLPNSTTLYTLTFDGNGADGGFVPDPIAGNGIIVLPYNSGNLTRTGYTFGGWNGWSTEPNGGGVTYFPGDYFDLKANHTLYAMWDDTTYHLSYRANFSPVVGSVPNSQDGFGDIILPGNVGGLVNSGKLFAGWQVDHNGTPDASVTYTEGDTFALETDTVMDAIWVTSLYKVVYLGNGNTSGQAPDAISTAGTINLSENNYDLAKTGYYFEGWNETGSTTLRLPGDAFSVTQNETFTASWQRINVGIDYDLNGADTGTVPVSWDGFYGDTPSIAGNTGGMTLAGYNFTGWNTRDDGSGDHYDVNQVVTMGESNLYLYAEWSLPTPPTPNTPQQIVYVVRFDGNGSNGGSVPVIIRWIDGSPAVSIPGNSGGLTKTGYTFGGWSLSAGGGSAISSLTPTNSSTLYAIWIKNPELPGTGGTTPKPTPSTPPAATIKLEAGAKQVIPNQIVPVKDVIKLEEGAVAEKVLINGKVVSAAVTGSNTVALPQLVGPADKIQVVERIAGKDVTADIAMVTEPVDLANVNFTTDSYFLDAPARRILDKVVAVVLQHGFTTVELVGHTDAAGVNVGYDNQALSHNRAIATEKYLQAKLAGHKVTIKVDAKAHVDPIAKNSTAAGRAANRRVEIVVK